MYVRLFLNVAYDTESYTDRPNYFFISKRDLGQTRQVRTF